MSNVYVACVHDRHSDPEIKVFEDSRDAEGWCRSEFLKTVAHPEYIKEMEKLPRDYVVWFTYKLESDEAWVIEREIHESSY